MIFVNQFGIKSIVNPLYIIVDIKVIAGHITKIVVQVIARIITNSLSVLKSIILEVRIIDILLAINNSIKKAIGNRIGISSSANKNTLLLIAPKFIAILYDAKENTDKRTVRAMKKRFSNFV